MMTNDFGRVYLGRQSGDDIEFESQPRFEEGEQVCCIRQSDLVKLINETFVDEAIQEVDITRREYEAFPPWMEITASGRPSIPWIRSTK